MLSLYEILKASKTGIAPDMWTALAGMNWGGADSGHEVKELTGIPPLSFTADGTPLLDYLISGNTVQNGKPTPNNPVDANGVGEIDNIFEGNIEQGGYSSGNPYTAQNRARSDTMILIQPNVRYYMNFTGLADQFTIIQYTTNGTYSKDIGSYLNAGDSFVFSSAWKLKFVFRNSDNTNISPSDVSNISLSRGYKIPISSGGVTTNIYLSSTQTVRRIKKVVITGTERIEGSSNPNYYIIYFDNYPIGRTDLISTHFRVENYSGDIAQGNTRFADDNRLVINYDSGRDGVSNFISWLQQQYSNDTPVCVWYVLATVKTGTVNEPLMKIGKYADTLSMEQAGVQIPTLHGNTVIDVLTDVKPSEMYIKYQE